MNKLMILACTAALVFAFALAPTAQSGEESSEKSSKKSSKKSKSDFALFDGTNPLDLDAAGKTGVLCGNSNKKGTALVAKDFTYYFSATSDLAATAECKVVYTDGDFVRYKIPGGTSFSLSQAGGSNEFDAAVRWDCDAGISGAGSATGQKNIFCLSCGETADTDAVCDTIVPTH